MSTRSIVGVALRDEAGHLTGSWAGRYVHFDGYPAARLPVLNAIIQRDGAAAAVEQLLAHDWSLLDDQQVEGAEVTEYHHTQAVAGYGLFYTDADFGLLTPTNADCGAEYLYLLDPGSNGTVIWSKL